MKALLKIAGSLTAIIVKGNPKYIKNNSNATKFYNKLKDILEDEGFKVDFDPGKPYTEPDPADLWVGHSRGNDRLRFSPSKTKVIKIGSPDQGAINHPQDKAIKGKSEPNKYHYKINSNMEQQIRRKARKAKQ